MLGLAIADLLTPRAVDLSLFYLLGVAYVGFFGGTKPGMVLAITAGAWLTWHEWGVAAPGPVRGWVLGWNGISWTAIMIGMAALHARAAQNMVKLENLTTELVGQKGIAEREVQRREELRRSILSLSKEGFFMLDREGKITEVNDAYCRMSGYTRQELLGMSLAELEAMEAPEEIREHARRLSLEGSDQFETAHRRKDGQIMPVEISAFFLPQRDASFGFARDISQRKQAERLLQAQCKVASALSVTSKLEDGLTGILNLSVQLEGVDCGGVYLYDTETGSLRLCSHLNLSETFVEAVETFPPETPETKMVMQGKPVYRLFQEIPPTAPTNAENLRGIAVFPLCHEGEVFGALNVASKIHEAIPPNTGMVLEAMAVQAGGALARIHTEQALHQAEARLRLIVSSAPVLIFALDENGVVVFEAGNAFRRIGINPGENLGKPARESYGRFAGLLENLDRARESGEFQATTQLGSAWFECWFSSRLDEEGKPAGFRVVATDITERHRLETQILEISDREQARIGQDIHDGLCQQLVSLGFDANTLERQLSERNQPEAKLAGRLAGLVDEAITESRRVARGLFPVRLSANGLASALEELAHATAARFEVPCLFEASGDEAPCEGATATHLYRIAQEALVNAVKHANARQLRIDLHSHPRGLELRVSDDGRGLLPGSKHGRDGMGLHIMEYRARTIGARLRIEPRDGGGTVVSCCVERAGDSTMQM